MGREAVRVEGFGGNLPESQMQSRDMLFTGLGVLGVPVQGLKGFRFSIVLAWLARSKPAQSRCGHGLYGAGLDASFEPKGQLAI